MILSNSYDIVFFHYENSLRFYAVRDTVPCYTTTPAETLFLETPRCYTRHSRDTDGARVQLTVESCSASTDRPGRENRSLIYLRLKSRVLLHSIRVRVVLHATCTVPFRRASDVRALQKRTNCLLFRNNGSEEKPRGKQEIYMVIASTCRWCPSPVTCAQTFHCDRRERSTPVRRRGFRVNVRPKKDGFKRPSCFIRPIIDCAHSNDERLHRC